MSDSLQPQLWVVAGPNGAGKSTLVSKSSKLLDKYNIPVINPDNVARSYSPENPNAEGVALNAGREALRLQDHLLSAKTSFVIETTLSGNHELALMNQAKTTGYKVNLVYIGVNTPGVSRRRVRQRVQDGGHNIPPPDVERRYLRSMSNLSKAMQAADRFYILDNSEKRPKLMYSMERSREKHVASHTPDWIKKHCPELLQKLSRGLSR